jgi:Protein of unknown function (DUF642)
MSTRVTSGLIWTCLVGMVLGFGSSAFCQTNLIKNGSFERPIVPYAGYEIFSTGETFLDWKVVGAAGNAAVVSGAYTEPHFTFPAEVGAQFLDLTGTTNSATGVAQTVSTISGAAYTTLTFWIGNLYDPSGVDGVSSTVNVWVDGQQVYTATNSRGKGRTAVNWQQFATTIVATSSQTTIAFINGDPLSDNANCLDGIAMVLQSE